MNSNNKAPNTKGQLSAILSIKPWKQLPLLIASKTAHHTAKALSYTPDISSSSS